MIRVLCRQIDGSNMANVGGPLEESYRTFDIDFPQLEDWLRKSGESFLTRSVIGVEVLTEMAS